jgi:hypothetical protein
MNFDKLRIVAELANVGLKQEDLLLTVMPEKPDRFKQLCELVYLYDFAFIFFKTDLFIFELIFFWPGR